MQLDNIEVTGHASRITAAKGLRKRATYFQCDFISTHVEMNWDRYTEGTRCTVNNKRRTCRLGQSFDALQIQARTIEVCLDRRILTYQSHLQLVIARFTGKPAACDERIVVGIQSTADTDVIAARCRGDEFNVRI